MTKFLKVGDHLINLEQVSRINLNDRVNGSRELSAPSSVTFRLVGPVEIPVLRFTGDEAEAIREFFSPGAEVAGLYHALDITPVAATEDMPL